MSAQQPSGGFSLFPSTGRPPSRSQGARTSPPQQQAVSPVSPEAGQGHRHNQHQHQSPIVGEAVTADVPIEWPTQAASVLRRSDPPARNSSACSRSSIAKMRLSLFDEVPPTDEDPLPPLPGPSTTPAPAYEQHARPQQHRPPALRSIFPQYNPDVPLDQQDYYPTQTSPKRIPRGVISRPLYSPTHQEEEQAQQQQQQQQSTTTTTAAVPEPALEQQRPWPPQQLTLQTTGLTAATTTSTAAAPAAVYPPASTSVAAAAPPTVVTAAQTAQTAPSVPVPSSTEELRSLWKVANGWKAGPSEGRVYCMRLACDADAPVYRLLSAGGQPLYRLHVNPTSAAAYVTLSRHDPGRPFREVAAGDNHGHGSVQARYDASKHWQTVLTTTLEEEARRHQPQDGLVALLYPQQAARIALSQPDSAEAVATAERECARLVWDDDTGHFFLVHPVLALPFCVGVERSAAWSRTTYTLEHLESPQHLARLTRDATGDGWLELDTAIASKIDAVYLADVAVAALLLVAHSDTHFAAAQAFAPPPLLPPKDAVLPPLAADAAAAAAAAFPFAAGLPPDQRPKSKKGKPRKKSWRDRMASSVSTSHSSRAAVEEYDLESQSSTLASAQHHHQKQKHKHKRRSRADDDEKLPGCLRLFLALFKCCFWCVSIVVRALLALAGALFQCLTHQKL